jgi:undecaprenyl-diphosphatase
MLTTFISIYKKYRVWIIGAILLILIALFIELSEDLVSETWINLFDQSFSTFIFAHRTSYLTSFMLFITSLGNAQTILVLLIISCSVFYILKHRFYSIVLIASAASSSILVSLLKVLIHRDRPEIQNALVIEKTFSFPSGHTMFAVAFYVLLGYLLFRISKNNTHRILLILISISISLLIGFSRIYLGAHWLSDVLASYLLGGSLLCLVIIGFFEKEILIKSFMTLTKKKL